jgi:hypothetical protein
VPVADTETDVAQNGQGEADEQGFVRGIRWDDFRNMRDKSHRADKVEKELDEVKRENVVLKTKLDLKPNQMKALIHSHEGEWTPEALRATAIDLGFAEPPEDEEPEEERQTRFQAQQVQRATAGASPPGKGPLLTAAQVNGWPQDRQMRFRNQHPDLWQICLEDPAAKFPNPGGAW